MAVIRCPHCGKPNPDIVEVCQYCDQPLNATAPLAGGAEPATPDWLKDFQGGGASADVPDWLKAATDNLTPATPSEAEPEAPDWLKSLGDAAQPADDVPDWLKSSTGGLPPAPATAGFSTAPISDEPEEAVPDWLKSFGATNLPSTPAPAAVPPAGLGTAPISDEPEEAVPDWLKSFGATNLPSTPAPATPATAGFSTAPISDEPEEAVPDWLKSFGATNLPSTPAPATPPATTGFSTAPISDEPEEAVPDWLKSFGATNLPSTPAPAAPPAGPSTPPIAAASEEAVPDWLKSVGAEAAADEAEAVPDWLKEATGPLAASPAAAEETPDWLREATGPLEEKPVLPATTPLMGVKSTAPFTVGAGSEAPSSEPVPDWLKSFGEAPETPATPDAGDTPDWLKPVTGPLTAPAETPAAEAPLADTGFLKSLGSEEPYATPVDAPAGDLPDWLKSATGPLPASGAPASGLTGELPDWLKAATGPLTAALPPSGGAPSAPAQADAPVSGLEPGELPDWLKAATGPLTAALPGAMTGALPARPADEVPDWLQVSTGALPPLEEPAAVPAAPAPVEAASDDWMTGVGAPAAEAAEPAPAEPDWLTSLREEAAPEADQPAAPGAEPGWLAALRPEPAAATPTPTFNPPADLAQGDLPSWLSAMRPIDMAATGVEPELDNYEESVGVLTGMRGVLRAEPSVVLPGRSATNVHLLNYTDAQTRQAAQLTKLLSTEQPAAAARRRALLNLPWERWLVAVALLLAVVLPLPEFGMDGLFPLPRNAPQEVIAAFDALNALPADKPVLVALEYEPAQAGELTPMAEVLVGHLARRGLPVVGLSTQVTGVAVTDAVFTTVLSGTGYTEGVNYLNFGYLPGGALGVLQLAADPNSVVGAGGGGNAWETPVLANVSRFEDFGAVVVVGAGPEAIRAWVEQTQGARTPLILATSASAAPLVRPYYDAAVGAAAQSGQPARIAGLLAGPQAAMQYNMQGGSVLASAATQTAWGRRWDMLGSTLLAVMFLLVAGNMVHGGLQLLRGRTRKAG